MSNLENNPYQNSLVHSLKTQNIQIYGGEYHYSSIFFLPKVIRNGRPDIFHIHDIHFFLQGKKNQHKHKLIYERDVLRRPLKFLIFVFQLMILKLFKVKVIWTVHEWNDKYDNGRQNIYGVSAIILGRLFDGIITHSYFTKQQIVAAMHLPEQNNVRVVYHGNYINAYENTISNQEARKFLGIERDKLVFLLFGNIYQNKGFLDAIDNFQKISRNDIFLLVVGQIAESDIGQIIHQKIRTSSNILFLPGRIADKDVQIYMNACDCVVLPYKVFTTSGVAILAMSFAKTCIAPRLGFFNEILDDSGAFLFNPKDNEALLKAMRQTIKQKHTLVQMSQYNFTKVTLWDWNSIGEHIVEIYQQSLSKSKKARIITNS